MSYNLKFDAGYVATRRYDSPFAMDVEEDAGLIADCKVITGYGYRAVERNLRDRSYAQINLLCDKIDFYSPASYSLAFALAVEKLGTIEVPGRAQVIRVILLEINRITSHLYFLSQLARDVMANNILMFALREREKYCDLFELYNGSRLGFGAIRIGGVSENATDGFLFKVEEVLGATEIFLNEINGPFVNSPVILGRLSGLGLITKENIDEYGLTGPNARASGIESDLRLQKPYSAYADLHLSSPRIEQNLGDTYARLCYRLEEIKGSIDLIRACIARVGSGDYCTKVGVDFAPTAGEVEIGVESPRGRLNLYLQSDGSNKPSWLTFSPPSFACLRYLGEFLKHERLEDLFLLIGSLDFSFSEIDR